MCILGGMTPRLVRQVRHCLEPAERKTLRPCNQRAVCHCLLCYFSSFALLLFLFSSLSFRSPSSLSLILLYLHTVVLSSPYKLIPDSAGVKRQADHGESTAHAAPTVVCLFEKHYRKTDRTVQFLLSNGAKWSVDNF